MGTPAPCRPFALAPPVLLSSGSNPAPFLLLPRRRPRLFSSPSSLVRVFGLWLLYWAGSGILPGLFKNVVYDRFLVMRTTDDNWVKMSDLCMFDVFENIDGCCSEVPKISFQSDCSVLVQVGMPDQSKLLKKLTTITDIPVSYYLHDSLNYTRRVVYCTDLLRYSEEKY